MPVCMVWLKSPMKIRIAAMNIVREIIWSTAALAMLISSIGY
jgi:hypothetical protein